MKRFFVNTTLYRPKQGTFSYGWVIFAVASAGHVFSVIGHNAGLAPFVEALLEEFQLSRLAFSTLYFWTALLAGCCLPVSGWLYDIQGTRLFSVLTSILLGLCCLCMGVLPHTGDWKEMVGIFISLWGIRLLAEGMLTVSCRSVIVRWFSYNRAFISAIASSIAAAGFGILPKVTHIAIERFGIRPIWIVEAIIFTVIMPLFFGFFLYDPHSQDEEEPIGDSLQAHKKNHFQSMHGYSLLQALKSRPFWYFMLAIFYAAFVGSGVSVNIIALGKEHQVSASSIMSTFPALAAVVILFNPIIGKLADRIALIHLVFFLIISQVLAILGIYNIGTAAGRWSYIFFNGITWSCYGVLKSITWIRLFGNRHLGHITAFILATALLASAIAPLIFNVFKSFTGNYGSILLVCAGAGIGLLFWTYKSLRSHTLL